MHPALATHVSTLAGGRRLRRSDNPRFPVFHFLFSIPPYEASAVLQAGTADLALPGRRSRPLQGGWRERSVVLGVRSFFQKRVPVFKNVIMFRIQPGWSTSIEQIEEALQQTPFTECGLTQERSFGWVPPRGEAHGALVEAVGGQYILKFMTESKAVPASVLNRKVKERVAQIEAATGRKPGKKESKELKEEAKLALLPMAFTKQAATTVWVDREQNLLVIDAGNQGRADEIVTCLSKALPGFGTTEMQTTTSAGIAMSEWLTTQEPPAGFSIDRECELKATDDSKAVVRYSKHPLDIEEVKQHIATGKVPTKLAMTWDERVSFVLTDTMLVKKISFLDVVFEGNKPEDSGFDADAAIATGELAQLIPDLVAALGGEMALGAAPADAAPAAPAAAQAPADVTSDSAPW